MKLNAERRISPDGRASAADQSSSGASAYERSVLGFRADPRLRAFVAKNFLQEDLAAAVSAYSRSEEFSAICRVLGPYLSSPARLLDLGAGRGLTSVALSAKGVRVTTLESDPSEVVGLGALARYAKARRVPLQLVRGDILRLPVADGRFDVAFCRSVLHHLADLGQGLREIYRVLRPGGLFIAANEHIISVFSRGKEFLQAHPAVAYGVDERAYPAYAYWWALRRAGFRRVRFFGHPLDFSEFQEATRGNPVRSCLVRLPLVGGGLARVLHAVHVATRAFLIVPERGLPATSIVSEKLCPQGN